MKTVGAKPFKMRLASKEIIDYKSRTLVELAAFIFWYFYLWNQLHQTSYINAEQRNRLK